MDNQQNGRIPYTYVSSGFSPFMKRSIDKSNADSVTAKTLRQVASNFRQVNNQQVNFDQSQITGALGDILRLGTILIDGRNGRISIYDDGNNEVGRIGELDG